MSAFYWDDLIESIIRDRSVVPVIGLDLWGVKEPRGEPPFYRELVVRTAGKLSAAGHGDFDSAPFPEFVDSALAKLGARAKLTRSLSAAHGELLAGKTPADFPDPLRLMAEITDFPLVLTTCIDGLASRAFRVPDSATLNSTLSEIIDLAPDWQIPARGAPPTLVHLFGRIAATPGFALTEEDTLEMMWNLQGEQRPGRLLSRLRRSHILVLGTRFPDWLARFFLRLLRGARLSVEGETFEAIADPEVSALHPLVSFLKPFNPQMRIYDEGSALISYATFTAGGSKRNQGRTRLQSRITKTSVSRRIWGQAHCLSATRAKIAPLLKSWPRFYIRRALTSGSIATNCAEEIGTQRKLDLISTGAVFLSH